MLEIIVTLLIAWFPVSLFWIALLYTDRSEMAEKYQQDLASERINASIWYQSAMKMRRILTSLPHQTDRVLDCIENVLQKKEEK